MKTPKLSFNTETAVRALSAIAHQSRLSLLRLLIQAGPTGIAAGELSRAAALNPPTASAQLLVLANAGLVTSDRQGRHVIYRAQFEIMSALLAFLMKDCCSSEQAICAPLIKAMRT